MVKISDLIDYASLKLKSVADNPRFEARILLAHVLSLRPSDIIVHPEKEVNPEEKLLFESYVNSRANYMPIAYITGEKDFFGMTFKVNAHTLIPRPETEMIVEEVVSSGKKRLLDLCSGSGCIPIASAKNADITALGIDISEGAVKIAEENALMHSANKNVTFKVCDVLKTDYFGEFDIITSNPPYITDHDMKTLPRDVLDFEPHIALSGGNDGLIFYRRITEIAPKNLVPGGLLIFELGIGESEAVASFMEKDFTDIKIKKDLAGIDRIITGRIK